MFILLDRSRLNRPLKPFELRDDRRKKYPRPSESLQAAGAVPAHPERPQPFQDLSHALDATMIHSNRPRRHRRKNRNSRSTQQLSVESRLGLIDIRRLQTDFNPKSLGDRPDNARRNALCRQEPRRTSIFSAEIRESHQRTGAGMGPRPSQAPAVMPWNSRRRVGIDILVR